MQPQQEAMMLRNTSPERLGERVGSRLDAAVGKRRQLGRIGLASRPRCSCVAAFGTKLARIKPCASRSASHVASFTSVLRPGTFLTCLALANISSNSPSLRMFHTGFQ